ncbi:MAG: N-6 DNA methylase [Clostridia bacterium]|nr:N-6 DNA methylase [Clostridia bacterium]
MNTSTLPLEAETRVLIDRTLQNLGWKLDGKDKNVFYEQPRTEAERKKLGGKRPDYVLYSKDSDKPLIVIEAKKKGSRIDAALEQGIAYARAIDAPLVFATDGVFCKAFHTFANRPPILNGEEIDEFIRETLALRYLTSYEVNTVSPKVQYDRKELIRIFDEANNMLRGEGLRAGIERFGEFANILFLKLISESEQIKRENGIETKFDPACSWESIKNIPSSTRIEYINKTVYDKLNALYNTDIFTPLQIRDASILKEIMDKLDPLMLTDVDSDVKGDAFEYFLKASTATKNDLGEYFTPRHIVKTMVRLVNPQIGEKVYDPFCGTGGFLIESFRYIYNNMPRNPKTLAQLREETVYGNEITNTARITKMNMILAGDGHSNIQMLDSLANPVEGKYDVVLANMPYSQKTKYGSRYDLPSTNGDSICVQHCMKAINSLSENGRMALVVPEGFLFRKDLAKTREYLLENCQLQSIISLPQGVFLPYTGVKTDIIYATKVNQKLKKSERRKDFWYFDVKSDGYTLDNHRRKLDTPSDISKYEEYRKLDNSQTEDMLKVGFEIIPLEKVRKNSFVLVGSRYRDVVSPVSSTKNTVKLSDVANFIRGVSFPKSSQKSKYENGDLGIVTTKAAQADGINKSSLVYVDGSYKKSEKLILPGDVLISLANSLDFIGRVTFVDKEYENVSFGAFMGLIRADVSKIDPLYLYAVLQSDYAKDYFKSVAKTTTNISNLTFEDLGEFLLPLPTIDEQIKFAKEIDGYLNIIKHSKAVVKSYTPILHINNAVSIVRVGDLFDVVSETINPQESTGIVNYIGLENIESQTGKVVGTISCDIQSIRSTKRVFKKEDILFGKLRPALNKVTVAAFDGICSTDIIALRAKNDSINSEFYSILLRSEMFNSLVLNGVSGGQLPRINVEFLLNLPIQKVDIEEQISMLEQIKKEQALIAPSEEIISIFTDKIKSITKKLWGE